MNKTTLEDAVVTQVFKTGEKVAGYWSRRGRKPQGYNVYIGARYWGYIPYNEKERPIAQNKNTYLGLDATGWYLRAEYYKNQLIEVVNSLIKDEEETKPKGKTK